MLIVATVTFSEAAVRRIGKIAFTSDRDGNREIYLMNSNGSNQIRITNNMVVDDHPKWSPDGTKIAFLSQRQTGEFAIFLMNADGSGKTEITPVNYVPLWQWSGWDAWTMSWAPDGRQIVFSNGSVHASTLTIVNSNGTNRRDLTTGFNPSWSPDGSKIMLLRSGPPPVLHHLILTIRPDGSDLQNITPALPGFYTVNGAPSVWSPDGLKIAFGSFDGANQVINIANANGSNPYDFVLQCTEFVPQGCSSASLPAWSPNGRTIAFVNWGIQSGTEIYVKNIGDDEVLRLTNSSGINSNPSWQPLSNTRFDFDGDGRSDVSVFRPSDSAWYLDRSTAGFTAVRFGISTDKIAPADFDGDGKADIAIYRNGVWWRINSSNSVVSAVQFGLAGDLPIPADYTGDGRDELAVYRNGQWWAFDLSTNQSSVINFGLPGDKPVPADYDGDGRVDQAVYRNGDWHLNRSSLGYTVASFGLPSDRPVLGDYDSDG
jgi:Tol biopolymer transport system component